MQEAEEDSKELSHEKYGEQKSLDSPPKGESGEPDIQSFMYFFVIED